jgi:serine/threonine protein kinase
MTETEIWSKWESQVVNGNFPLRRFLGRSNHSVVFLTECRAQNLANAAIKIIPADPARAEAQLSRWQVAADLSHPHLIRLLESGRCKLGGHPFLFAVTEYAEQNLAQILPHRALTPDEVREMLAPALDALAFLHGQNLVHGQLKSANFLVVDDQLKLASDTIRPARDATGVDLAGDVRALGATIVEALTQTRPALNAPAGAASLPATLSPGLADAVRRCLSPEPSERPTVSELRNLIDPASDVPSPQLPVSQTPLPLTPVLQAPLPELSTQPVPEPASARPPSARWLVPAAAVGLVLLALWGGTRMLRSHPDPRPKPIPIASQPVPAPEAVHPVGIAQPPPATPAVMHEEIPAISRSSRESVRGQIKVAVSVTVDRAGNVVAENLEAHGSSKYFARLATDAAKKWKFAPDTQSPREWLVQFEFSRDGVTGHAIPRVKQ